ncbi:MAG TPA: rod shape-determining protein MreC [Candidatus Paceibacterota bacterium]|nr:rod shape-determining protein MreC [Candidatus Paceibacterota bacterium]
MTYLRRTNRGSKVNLAKTALAIFVLALVFLVNLLFPRFYPSLFYPVTSLFWRGESSSVGFLVYMGKIVQSKYGLVVENRRLRDEIASRDASAYLIDSLKGENERLKETLGRTAKGKSVLGVILSRPPVSPYDTLVLDVGAKDGVQAGDKVFANGDVLIGEIAEAYGSQSKAALYSTPGRVTEVLVGTTTIAAEATGKGGGNFSMRLPAASKVAKGAAVSLPHIRSHVFGVVDAVMLDSSDSLMTVLFASPANINQLRFVEVDVR